MLTAANTGCQQVKRKDWEVKLMSEDKTAENRIDIKKLSKIVRKAKKGDKRAIDELVEETSDYIFYYCLTLLQDKDKALDAVQDIYVILLSKLKTLKRNESFLGWLKVITANYCKDKIKRDSQEISFDDVDYSFIYEDINISPDKSLETEEICGVIINSIHSLSDIHRECILMRYYQDMSIEQIANVLQVKEGTVKSRLYYARDSIKKELEKNGITNTSIGGFIAYSLTDDSLQIQKPNIELEKIINSAKLPAAAGAETLPTVVKGVSTGVAAMSLPLKAAIIASASVIAIGGIGAYYYTNRSANEVNVTSAPPESSTQFETTETDPVTYLKSLSYSEEDMRKELVFDEKEENLNSLNNKEYIFDRMNNSIDYFKTMQGSVEIGVSGKRLYTVFYIDRTNGQYKELVYDLTDTVPMLNYEKTQYIYPYSYYCRKSDNKEVEWMFNDKEKEEMKLEFNPPFENPQTSPVSRIEELSKTNLTKRMKENDNNREVKVNDYTDRNDYLKYINSRVRFEKGDKGCLRGDPIHLPTAHFVYFPYAMIFNYHFENFANWDITTNHTNQNTVSIQYHSGEKEFELIVNKITGMVESCDYAPDLAISNGNFNVDKPIDQSVFEKIS